MYMGGSYLYMIKDSIQFYIDVVTSPVVAFLLLSIFFLGLVYQLFSQRVNIIGILAVLSIFIFFSGHLLTGGGNMLTLILILLSGFLILIEFFVIGTLLGRRRYGKHALLNFRYSSVVRLCQRTACY